MSNDTRMKTYIKTVAFSGSTRSVSPIQKPADNVQGLNIKISYPWEKGLISVFFLASLLFFVSFSGKGQADVFYPGFFQDLDVYYFEYQQSWNTEGLKGPVKSVKEKNYKGEPVNEEQAKNNLADIRHKVYNAKGKIVEYSVFDPSGNFKSRSTGKYDQAENLTEWDKFDAKGNLIFKITYEYRLEVKKGSKDKMGLVTIGNLKGKAELVIEETSYALNFSTSNLEKLRQSVSKYNSDNKLIERTVQNADGTKEKETITNVDGNMSHKIEIWDASGSLSEKKIIKYSSSDAVAEKLVMKKNNVIVDRRNYQEGNLVKQNVYNQHGELVERRLFNYRTPGLPFVLSTYDAHNELTSRTFVKYDNYGQPTEFHSFTPEKTEEDSKGQIKTTYDSKGNWVKQVNVVNGSRNAVSVIEREIEYF